MSAKIYQRILQVAIFLSLGIIFLLFSGLLFPYISSKQLSFNVLMELLLPFWLILIWKFPDFRPKRSWITWGLVAYLSAILLSCFTGVDYNLSFWGDVERLLGFFHIFHFFLLYLYIITAFRRQEDWYWLFSASVIAASFEAIIVLSGDKIGTIGNTAYVSGYMLFNLYFAVLLLLRTNWRRQWPFYMAIILMLFAFFKADTSGAIIGLGASLLLLLFLFGMLAARRHIRRLSWVLLFTGLIAIFLLFSQYQQDWFQKNPFLRDLSVNKNTFQTRLLSWQGAARDFSAHPLLGTGFGNYAIIFDRQFDANFFNYALTETYFDRAHNNLIDIVSTTGLLGLISYGSIFAAAAWAWFGLLRRYGKFVQAGEAGNGVRELLVLAALLAAYFIQNLAVFDSFATYFALMMVLAYLVFLSRPITEEEDLLPSVSSISTGQEISLLSLFTFIILIILIIFNVRPWLMMNRVIDAYSYMANGQAASGFLAYHRAFALKTPLDRDGRTTLLNIVVNDPTIFARLAETNIKKEFDYVISLAEKNISYNPFDSLAQMQAAQLYDIGARYYRESPIIFKIYSDKSLAAIDLSIAASPNRIPLYFIKAQIQTSRGDLQGTEKSLLQAEALNANYPDTPCQLANYYFLIKDKRFETYTDTCLDRRPVSLSPEVTSLVLQRYQENSDAPRLLATYRLIASRDDRDPLLYVNLAKAELAAGNFTESLNAAVHAADLDPSLRPAVQEFLKSLTASTSTSTIPIE